jgi:hypothetical protein
MLLSFTAGPFRASIKLCVHYSAPLDAQSVITVTQINHGRQVRQMAWMGLQSHSPAFRCQTRVVQMVRIVLGICRCSGTHPGHKDYDPQRSHHASAMHRPIFWFPKPATVDFQIQSLGSDTGERAIAEETPYEAPTSSLESSSEAAVIGEIGKRLPI